VTTAVSAPKPRTSLPDIPFELLETFRAYQRTGSYQLAAADLGLTAPQVKRRLMSLYGLIGVGRSPGQNQALLTSYLLRDLPY
jgi:hypothetical protein